MGPVNEVNRLRVEAAQDGQVVLGPDCSVGEVGHAEARAQSLAMADFISNSAILPSTRRGFMFTAVLKLAPSG